MNVKGKNVVYALVRVLKLYSYLFSKVSNQQYSLCTFLHHTVFLNNLALYLRGQIVLNVEGLPNLVRSLVHDHVRDDLARDLDQLPDVQVVGGHQEVHQHPQLQLSEERSG